MPDLHLVQICAAKLSCLGPVLQLYLLILWKQECPNSEEKANIKLYFTAHTSVFESSVKQ